MKNIDELLSELLADPELRESFATARKELLDQYDLTVEQRAALLDIDVACFEAGVNPVPSAIARTKCI